MEVNKILIRASSSSKIMTNGTGKNKDKMGKTAQTYLRHLLIQEKYHRVKEITSKYLEKGIAGEEDGITLLSLFHKKYFVKNTVRLSNEFITGLPDIVVGDDIHKAEEGYDTKCPYDIFTMPLKTDDLNTDYYWQAQSYMWLTNAKKWTISYCLINSPFNILKNELNRLWYKLEMPDEDNPVYLIASREIEKLHVYNLQEYNFENNNNKISEEGWDFDVPLENRLVEFVVERNDEDIERLKDRVVEAREYMEQLNELL